MPIWPALPTAFSPGNAVNLAITKVDNGDLNTPGHIATAIPNTLITTNYDAATTAWTVCFPVSGFSFFYAHSLNPNNIPLPVHLLSFTGEKWIKPAYFNGQPAVNKIIVTSLFRRAEMAKDLVICQQLYQVKRLKETAARR